MGEVIPLTQLRENEEAIVVSLQVRGWGILRRLTVLGIVPGARVRVENIQWGPVVINVEGVRVALGRGIASRILVRRVQ